MKKRAQQPQAQCVDNVLILSFPNAIDPIVWRMDVNEIKTASFEIQSLKEKNAFKLFLKPKNGKEEIIACFNDKDTAFEALMLASDALHNDNANIKSTTKTKSKKEKKEKKRGSGKWLALFGGVILIAILYFYMISLIPNTQSFQPTSTSLNNEQINTQDKTGVPVSADDFFQGM